MFHPNSQSQLRSPQEGQQAVSPWSLHAPPFGQPPSPFLRKGHTLSTTAFPAGELYLFGGYGPKPRSRSNDLYLISTRDFSTTLLQTSGDVPDPRDGHCAVITGTTLLISGGKTGSGVYDDSLYLLNLGTTNLFDVKARFSCSEFLGF